MVICPSLFIVFWISGVTAGREGYIISPELFVGVVIPNGNIWQYRAFKKI